MKRLLALALAAGLAPLAFADGNTSTASATASVTILAPVYAGFADSLNFGKVVISAAPTTLDINGSAAVHTDSNADVFTGSAKIRTMVPTLTLRKDATASVSVNCLATMASGSFTLHKDVVNAINGWAEGPGTSLVTKYYGSLAFDKVPAPGTDSGTLTVMIAYK